MTPLTPETALRAAVQVDNYLLGRTTQLDAIAPVITYLTAERSARATLTLARVVAPDARTIDDLSAALRTTAARLNDVAWCRGTRADTEWARSWLVSLSRALLRGRA